MAVTVSINIVGRAYEISCDEGQEDYLLSLAHEVDRRAQALLKVVGQVGDARLLVMVGLSMADEMADLKKAMDRQALGQAQAIEPADTLLAEGIEALAQRIDAIAERLEKA
jgi:cell division protein ZapA